MKRLAQSQDIELQHIHLLDLDGTLVNSARIDNLCYWRAVTEVFDRPEKLREPGEFKHVTDSGILQQWCNETIGQPPDERQTSAVKCAFVDQLQQAFNRDPREFEAIRGARAFLESLMEQPGHALAIATGGWRRSARFKLQQAGLDDLGLPLACSDDASSRLGILRHARRLACSQLTVAGLRDTICYGDAIWDLEASRRLGARFIGIANGEAAVQLAAAGAQQVVADYAAMLV